MGADYASIPALSWLCGARVQRIDGPFPGCFSFTLFDRGVKQTLVVLVGASTRGVGVVQERPKGAPASAFVQRLRTHVEGGRLREACWLGDAPETRARALLLSFERGGEPMRLIADFDPKAPNLFLLRADDTVAGAADERTRRTRFPQRESTYTPGKSGGITPVADEAELIAAGKSLLHSDARRTEDGARMQVRTQARALLKRAERKADAIRGDLARAETAPQLRREAQLLLCHLETIPRGAARVRLCDETVEPAEWLEIALDPALDPNRNAQHRFERARKAERGVAIASSRLAEAASQVDALRAFLRQLDEDAPLGDLTSQAAALGLSTPTQGPGAPKQPKMRVPYRTFVGTSERKILVGKGAADNDTLTLTVARPHDVWLHVRGTAGSHVVVPLDRKATIDPQLLLDAAHLAAHFSKQRGEPTAEIAHTERRFVRKPKGAAPGSVNVDRERVFVLRIEPARLARLLANERS